MHAETNKAGTFASSRRGQGRNRQLLCILRTVTSERSNRGQIAGNRTKICCIDSDAYVKAIDELDGLKSKKIQLNRLFDVTLTP